MKTSDKFCVCGEKIVGNASMCPLCREDSVRRRKAVKDLNQRTHKFAMYGFRKAAGKALYSEEKEEETE